MHPIFLKGTKFLSIEKDQVSIFLYVLLPVHAAIPVFSVHVLTIVHQGLSIPCIQRDVYIPAAPIIRLGTNRTKRIVNPR